jgi:hypothetical protein
MTEGTPVDLDKLRSLSVGSRTRPQIREWRSDDGERHKAVTDERNNTVTQHARGDRQDVLLRPGTIRRHISEL